MSLSVQKYFKACLTHIFLHVFKHNQAQTFFKCPKTCIYANVHEPDPRTNFVQNVVLSGYRSCVGYCLFASICACTLFCFYLRLVHFDFLACVDVPFVLVFFCTLVSSCTLNFFCESLSCLRARVFDSPQHSSLFKRGVTSSPT